MLKKMLMKIARAVLDSVIQQINQLIQETIESVLNPVNGIIQEIGGGETWRGMGASAFADELTNLLVPDVETILQSNQRGIESIVRAEQIMAAADDEVARLADGWSDLVSGIY
ncbi:MAG: WXG100 family type VII secretion target [Chloroflexota bacterium]